MESVMMMFVVVAIWLAITGILRQSQFFQNIFGAPWARLANTMEFGIPASDKSYTKSHPTSWERHSTTLNQGGG